MARIWESGEPIEPVYGPKALQDFDVDRDLGEPGGFLEFVAAEAGVDVFLAEATPEAKLALIRQEQTSPGFAPGVFRDLASWLRRAILRR